MINLIKTILSFKTKEEALRFHIYAISAEEGLRLSPSDIDVSVEVYNKGYNQDFFKACLDKGYFRSEQTIRNSIAKLTKVGVLLKTRGDRKVNPKFLPKENNSDFVFNYQVNYDLQKQ